MGSSRESGANCWLKRAGGDFSLCWTEVTASICRRRPSFTAIGLWGSTQRASPLPPGRRSGKGQIPRRGQQATAFRKKLVTLVVGESLHRGYPRGACGWQQASGETRCGGHARRTGENSKVKRWYVE